MSKLKGKIALITGANSGIGYASAQSFIENGAKVIITGRNAESVSEAAKSLGNQTVGFVSNQGKMNDIKELAQNVENQFSKIDILFINAGVAKHLPIAEVDETLFDETVNTNFKGVFFLIQKFVPLLNPNGVVLVTSSILANEALPNAAVYSASKAALNSLMRSAAAEYAPLKIRFNVIAPGPVYTPIYEKLGVPNLQDFIEKVSEKTLIGRLGKPEEVAKLALFLASDDASYITGNEYVIDGGATVNRLWNV